MFYNIFLAYIKKKSYLCAIFMFTTSKHHRKKAVKKRKKKEKEKEREGEREVVKGEV